MEDIGLEPIKLTSQLDNLVRNRRALLPQAGNVERFSLKPNVSVAHPHMGEWPSPALGNAVVVAFAT